jgi:outer membrane protein
MKFPRKALAGLIITLTGMASAMTAHGATLQEIYNLAVENDPQIGAAQAVFLSQSEVVAQNRALLLPSVGIGGATTDNRRTLPTNPSPPTDRYNDHGWQAVLTQPVFRLDSWYRFKQAKKPAGGGHGKFRCRAAGPDRSGR